MPRPLTLFTGQWADLPLATLARRVGAWGYDGLELACWGDHFDVNQALASATYCQERHALLAEHGLRCWAISNHILGQCVCDPIDNRHRALVSDEIWGDGDPEGVRQRAAAEMIRTAQAAAQFGVPVVNGFTGSSIWAKLYPFPPTPASEIAAGYADFATRWRPILDEFQQLGIRFALEVHPTEIAYDIHTFAAALEAVDGHPAFGINFDPSHLIPQGIDPVELIYAFPDRIFHVHIKDSVRNLNGRNSSLASHLPFGDPRRGWDFVSPGRGEMNLDAILRALQHIGYEGPLSVEWEDSGMEREFGARESLALLRAQTFPPPTVGFEEALKSEARAGTSPPQDGGSSD